MRKLTDDQKAWLLSEGAARLRGEYSKQATMSVNELLSVAMNSTDPNVRGHALAYATWKKALKELELPNGSE